MYRTALCLSFLSAIALMAGHSRPAAAQDSLLVGSSIVGDSRTMEQSDSSFANQALVSRLPSNYFEDRRNESTSEAVGGQETIGNALVFSVLGVMFAVGLTITGVCMRSWRSGSKPVKIMAYQ